MKVWRPQTAYALKQGPAWEALLTEVAACGTPEATEAWWADFIMLRHRDYPGSWSLALRDIYEAHKADLLGAERHAELDEAYREIMRS